MAKIDISETPEAKRLDAEVVRLHNIYEDAAAKASAAYKKAGRPKDEGNGSYAQPYNSELIPAYQKFLELMDIKKDTYIAWMRAASRHGKFLNPPAERA